MKTGTQMPPRWSEALLERMLGARDRETVVGDLREEYCESVFPLVGRLRADVWYLRQAWSLAPKVIVGGLVVKRSLWVISVFTFACACWLGVMEMVLRHPGYGARVCVAALIAVISVATMALRAGRWLAGVGAVLIWIGGQAFYHNLRAAHFEGFVVIISVALLMQGLLSLISGVGSRSYAGCRTL